MGRIGLGFSPIIGHVDCVDPNRGMLDESGRLSAERGLKNVSLFESTAEEMGSGLVGYQGATIASAFHWVDRSLVMETLDRRPAIVREGLDRHKNSRRSRPQ
ncbi:hypothetical protein IVB05_09915 [Bradyrhizobium sp. 170]|nr:hypothetical protein IVB05_09915 [Bradyrhizobium sp. 170]